MRADSQNADYSAIYSCLDRQLGHLDWLPPLQRHLDENLPDEIAAIGLDTNALKALRREPLKAEELVSFAEAKNIPIIIPGQCAQEFWNNHGVFVRDLQGIFTALQTLKNKVGNSRLGDTQRETLGEIEVSLDQFKFEIEDANRPELLKDSFDIWQALMERSHTPYVPRTVFHKLGEIRFATKVAPGFAESKPANQALGDFYVWADFLLGLQRQGLAPPEVDADARIVFVTDDKKPDWKTSGKPHPTLLGEVFELTGMTLDIIGAKDLFSITASV